jgi:hypothetical protein
VRLKWLLLVLFALAAIPAWSYADSSGVAFDRIQWHAPNASPLAVGSFAADRAALIKLIKPTDIYPQPTEGLLGNLPAASDPRQPEFVSLYRFSYLGDWMRVDDPIAMTSVIKRPDLHELIFLNLFTRTYRIVSVPASSNPAIQTSSTASEADANYEIRGSGEGTGPTVIDGVSAIGFGGTISIANRHETRDCPNGFGTMRWTQFRASAYDAPFPVSLPTLPPLENSCTVAVSPDSYSVEPSILRKVVLYRSLVFDAPSPGYVRAVQAMIGQSTLPYARVEEYGNIARLGAADKALFEIPAGFTPGK